nr:hypothetical protein [Tanacetum cinerariifolium]
MLAPGNYVQWKSRIKRYIDTKPNHELIHYFLTNSPYELGWIDKEILIFEGSPITRTKKFQETYKNVSQGIRDQLNAEAEAVQIILTWIDNDIYSTVDACPNAYEMWKAIKRLKQGCNIGCELARCSKLLSVSDYYTYYGLSFEDCNIGFETPMNMTPENKAHFEAEKEAIHLILTGIGNEIYSTVDACQTAQEMWEAIKRLQQVQAVDATDDSLAIPEHTTVETPMNMNPENKAHFETEKEAIHLILTGIGNEIYLTVDACQTAQEMWEAIKRLQQGESLNIQDVKTIFFWEFDKFTSHDGETMESYYTRFYKQYQKEVNELCAERLARDANPLALVATAQTNQDPYYQTSKYHKSHAPSSKPSILTRSHTTTRYKGKEIAKLITTPSEIASKEDSDPKQAQRDKDMQKNLALIAKYFKKIYKPTNDNLKTSSNSRNKNVDTTPREKVGSLVVQQSGIQCFNCKEFRHFAKECRKSKRVKDSTYHKEKMLMCKQAEQGVSLQAEQYDWLADTDKEVDEHELEAHYSYMAKIQEIDQNDVESDDEHVALANLIANLKLDTEFEKYKAFNDRTIDYDKLEHLKAQLQDKNIPISELKKLIEKGKGKSVDTNFDKPFVVRQPNAQWIPKPSVLGKPAPFSNSIERIYFPKTESVPKTNVSESLSKPVTVQTLPKIARQAIVQLILFIVDSGCTKHMTGNLKLLCNFVEKFLGTIRFDNDQFAPILRYGDLVQGNVMINRVAFRKSTCFVRDLQGNDLLIGNRGSDLYTISLQESTSSTPLCLMAKASPTQAWLWHRRLSNLNSDYINLLSKKDIVIGLPKLKYVKDQLCSSCELSKSKRSSFKSKPVPSLKRRLNSLHMNLCGPMRVASINGKKYILVIIDDYSRYTWTLFLRSKDETPEVLKDFIIMI